MKVLHQGGLQNPVTAAVYYYCASKEGLPQPVDAKSMLNGIPGQLRVMKFNATDTGFTVHEILTQNRLAYPITAGDKAGDPILPDEGFNYVFKAEAKLSVNWSESSGTPKITLDKIGITFGSAIAKASFDDRWFYQKWVDNAGYYTGFNAIGSTKF